MNVTPKAAKAEARYIWYPEDAAYGQALAALSDRFGLTRLNSPLEASRGPALLLYQTPEHHLYQALLQDQAPADALAAWSAQAEDILCAVREEGAQTAVAGLSQFILSPQAFITHLGLPGGGAPDESAPSVPPVADDAADDPVLLALATACLQQDSIVLSLAQAVQQAALPPAAPSAAASLNTTAAIQAHRNADAQAALLQEQKNLMHQELETLQILNCRLAESQQRRIAAKEQALQAAGRKIRSLEAHTALLQDRLLGARTPKQTRLHSLTAGIFRLIAPLRSLRQNQAGQEQIQQGRK
ncbi:hypothetical protein [Leisingera sp. NJS204]|uniref:hypothetical protein n=1 Tax=Leisingera sp. NJS204 TaxID=2508307 RepID=UPI00101345FD|nr:hypothetical protein [Leisingera sp. NJS204]QAX32108.1 hypothetical protein ETW24_22230 [Leisingera sp. NJS204]